MSCKIGVLNICGRHNDYKNAYQLRFTNKDISSCIFFIDVKDNFNNTVKRYEMGSGLTIEGSDILNWEFGNLLDIPEGSYDYAIKMVEDDKPLTIVNGKFTVLEELVSWK